LGLERVLGFRHGAQLLLVGVKLHEDSFYLGFEIKRWQLLLVGCGGSV